MRGYWRRALVTQDQLLGSTGWVLVVCMHGLEGELNVGIDTWVLLV